MLAAVLRADRAQHIFGVHLRDIGRKIPATPFGFVANLEMG